MRRLLFLLTLVLAACGSDGSKTTPEFVQHYPEILSVTVSPVAALYMEGDGSVIVSAEIAFSDDGRDIKTMWVRLPDGSTIEFDEAIDTETGTLTEGFAVPTNRIGTFHIQIWLEDKAGSRSAYRVVDFDVIDDDQLRDWTSQLSGLPYTLVDVIWDGSVFIAVGDNGTILTSGDGIDWTERESGTDATLAAVAAYGSDIFAVGEDIVLLSTDHGETWVTKDKPVEIIPGTVTVNSSQVVVGGRTESFDSIIMVSEDRGGTWQAAHSQPVAASFLSDLIHSDELFVATADSFFSLDGGWIFVSPDGLAWNESFRSVDKGLLVAIHAGGRFTVAGRDGAVFSSFDGLNWTEIETPVVGVEYLSAASNGSRLVLAGGHSCPHFQACSPPEIAHPAGITSVDGGVSWYAFYIDGNYQSHGMAFGNGRFVSVGQSAPRSGEGAIYTTD